MSFFVISVSVQIMSIKTRTSIGAYTLFSALVLSACGGSGSSSQVPTPDPAVTKKSINVDNLGSVLSQYLLYHYRVDTELPQLRSFAGTGGSSNGTIINCSKRGTASITIIASTVKTDYNACETEAGTIFSGGIATNLAQGPLKTNLTTISDLQYQKSDDRDLIKLSGTYTDKTADLSRSPEFKLVYNNGTSGFEYTVDITRKTMVDIKSTAISGNQHFILTDMADNGSTIPPVLSADDDSNVTINIDNAGAATLALRNTKGGTIITSKTFSKAEVDDLLKGARRVKP